MFSHSKFTIKLHQATSTYRYRAQLHHARLTFLQQLQNAAGSRSTFRCRGNGTPTVGPFTWSARCSGMLWAIMAIMGWLNIFEHIQTTLHSKKSKLTLDIIRHHWASLDMDSRPYAAYAVGLWKKWTCWGYSNSMPGLAWKKFMRTGWLQQVLNYSSILVQVQKSESKLIYINLSNLCVTYFVSYQIQ